MKNLLSRRKFLVVSSLFGAALLIGCTANIGATSHDAAPTAKSSHTFHPFDFNKRTVTLNNGIEMPIIGIGMWYLKPDEAYNSVSAALKNGYRLIDGARVYENEEAVGRAVRDSGIPRSEIFVTTKIYGTVDYSRAAAAIDERLKALGLDYIDLLLLHMPDEGDEQAYLAMEQAVKDGKVRSIGVANFNPTAFSRLMKVATITPVLVQNEVHPFNQDLKTKEFLKQYGTQMQAWYPLGGRKDGAGSGGKDVLFAEPTIVALAKKYGKSPAQILLRWQVQAGNIAIPGSSNPAHIKENIEIFDFALTDDEMKQIAKMDKQTKFAPPFWRVE